MKKIIIPVILISAFFSCNGQQPKSLEQIMEDIETAQYHIPDSVYSFFADIPKGNESTKLIMAGTNATVKNDTFSYSPIGLSTLFLVKIYEFSDINKKENLAKEYADQSLFSTQAEYKNYYVISDEYDLLKFIGDSLMKDNFSQIKMNNTVMFFSPFIERYSLFFSPANKCGLKDGYTIHVLNSGNQYVLPEKYKYEWDILPPEMQHGYLSGVAYKEDEPYIIYWVTAW